MSIKDYIKRHKIGVTIGGAILGLVAYSNIDNMYDPIVEGQVVQKATIPKDLPERSQQTHPYWIDVQSKENGILRLNFDTHDIGYDTKTHKQKVGFFIQFGRIGDFEGRARSLEQKIQVGDKVKVKVDESSGQERTVESIEGLHR